MRVHPTKPHISWQREEIEALGTARIRTQDGPLLIWASVFIVKKQVSLSTLGRWQCGLEIINTEAKDSAWHMVGTQ